MSRAQRSLVDYTSHSLQCLLKQLQSLGTKNASRMSLQIHWRYDASPQNPYAETNPSFLDAIQESNTFYTQNSEETVDMINRARYDAHDDEPYLAFYKVPQFGICIGKLDNAVVACAVIRIVAGKCMPTLYHRDAQDVQIAEITSVMTAPQNMGYGTELMKYIVTNVKDTVDALELKVDTHYDEDRSFSGASAVHQSDEEKEAEGRRLKAEEARRLISFYEKAGFCLQVCQCDKCRWRPNDIQHVQMIHKPAKTQGQILLFTDISYECGLVDQWGYRKEHESGNGYRG